MSQTQTSIREEKNMFRDQKSSTDNTNPFSTDTHYDNPFLVSDRRHRDSGHDFSSVNNHAFEAERNNGWNESTNNRSIRKNSSKNRQKTPSRKAPSRTQPERYNATIVRPVQRKRKGSVIPVIIVITGLLIIGYGLHLPEDSETESATAETQEAGDGAAGENDDGSHFGDTDHSTAYADGTSEADSPSGYTTIERQVIFDQQDIRMTAENFFDDGTYAGIKVTIENNSDTDLHASTDYAALNHIMINEGDTYLLLYSEVPAHQSVTTDMDYDVEEAKKDGFDQISSIMFDVKFLTNDYDTYAETDCITIQTNHAESAPDVIPEGAREVFSNDYVRISAPELPVSVSDDIRLYAENLSDQTLTLTSDDTVINGQDSTGTFYYAVVFPGCISTRPVTLDDKIRADGASSVRSLSMMLSGYDKNLDNNIFDGSSLSL